MRPSVFHCVLPECALSRELKTHVILDTTDRLGVWSGSTFRLSRLCQARACLPGCSPDGNGERVGSGAILIPVVKMRVSAVLACFAFAALVACRGSALSVGQDAAQDGTVAAGSGDQTITLTLGTGGSGLWVGTGGLAARVGACRTPATTVWIPVHSERCGRPWSRRPTSLATAIPSRSATRTPGHPTRAWRPVRHSFRASVTDFRGSGAWKGAGWGEGDGQTWLERTTREDEPATLNP